MRSIELSKRGNVIFAAECFRSNPSKVEVPKRNPVQDLIANLKHKIPNLENWDEGEAVFVYKTHPKSSAYGCVWFTVYPRNSLGIKDIVIDQEYYEGGSVELKRVALKEGNQVEVFTRTSVLDGNKHTWTEWALTGEQKDKEVERLLGLFKNARPQSEVDMEKPNNTEVKAHFTPPGIDYPKLVV